MGFWQWIGFAVFCLLAGSRWLVENAWPSVLPPLVAGGLHFLVLAVVGLAFFLLGERSLPAAWWRIGLAGVLLFGVPALVGEWAGSQAGPTLFTFVPLCVVVGVAAAEQENGSRRLMMPALLGAAGGLLVLPFALPATGSDAARMGVVLAAVTGVAVGSVSLHRSLQEIKLAVAVCLVCGCNAVLLGGIGFGLHPAVPPAGAWLGELGKAALYDVPEISLLLWLLRAVRPEQMATRYFVVPLVTATEGVVLLRPGLDGRMLLGLTSMVVGAIALFVGRGAEERPSSLRLRG